MSTTPDGTANSPLPMNPDLAGYPTTEALANGYRASGAEAQRLRQELEKRDALLAQVLTNGANGNQRTPVPDRNARPEDRLTEFGIPVDALEQYVNDRVNGALAPIANGMAARGRLVSDHPDYVQFENDVAAYISQDPDLSQRYPKMFAADPAGAMEYAFLKFGDSRRRTGAPPEVTGANTADAQIPGSRQGDSRRTASPDQEVQDAYERFQKTGSSKDATAFAKARLKGVISEDWLRQ